MNEIVAILLVGAPGSGKSTWGKEQSKKTGIEKLCPDEFRAKFGSGENDQTVSGLAFAATRNGMESLLSNNKSVIIDATNMYKKTRKQFLDIAKKYNIKTIAVVFECSKEELLKRNQKRGKEGGRNVPEEIIDNMLSKYERPDVNEFDSVNFINKI